MSRYFITGGAGQVGSTVAEILLKRGNEVVSIDNFSTGRKDNLTNHAKHTFIEGSIADKATIEQIFGDYKPEFVIHTAASYKDPENWHDDILVNGVGTANIARASKENKVKRLIYFQTALCYGTKPTQNPIQLDHSINPVNSSYAISKTAGEHYVQFSGVDWVTFRLANVIGPRNVSGPLPIFYSRLKQGKKCFVTPARRDFCYAEDLAKVVVKAADGLGNGTYHFSSGKDVAIIDLYNAVVKAMKINDYPEAEVKPLGPDDAASILLDPSRTFADFGDVKFTSLQEIADKAVAHWDIHGVEGGYTHLKLEKHEK
jgi:UDP-glucose 4-epimerase